ncbi:hypothetical protein, partial [Bradyrhizobium sp. CIR48]|uniref:hypothetical protein n=1 Tax=Bradyrhizobium sp. CIR48 TaxID=2663840 RepID=UPI001AEF33B6
GLSRGANRGRPFLMEQVKDKRSRYYKGGQRRSCAVPTTSRQLAKMVGTLGFAHPTNSSCFPASPRKKPHATHPMIASVEFSTCEISKA